jgi:hypothetical protein
MNNDPTPPRVLLAQLDRAWRRLGVPSGERRLLEDELAPDLLLAITDGHDPVGLLTPDVDTFARRLAEARGVLQVPPRHANVQVGGLLGAALTLLTGAALASPVHTFLTAHVQLRGRHPIAGVILAFGSLGILSLLGCLLGTYLAIRYQPAAGATVRRVALFLPPAAGLGIGLAVAVGKSSDYSTDPAVILAEIIIVALSCALALVAARRSAISSMAQRTALRRA